MHLHASKDRKLFSVKYGQIVGDLDAINTASGPYYDSRVVEQTASSLSSHSSPDLILFDESVAFQILSKVKNFFWI
jgi:hypothetical protein